MKKKFLLGLIAIISLASCKKENELSLKGKWNVDNITTIEFDMGVQTDTDVTPGNGMTFDFQNNGNVVVDDPVNGSSTVPYVINPDSKVEMDGTTYEIRNLTASGVTLYSLENLPNAQSMAIHFNLKR